MATNVAIARTKKKTYKAGETYTGSNPLLGFAGFDTTGLLDGLQHADRQDRLAEELPEGIVLQRCGLTAGNVVFSGRNNGEFVAYNAANGEQLWSFQTGAGAKPHRRV